MISHIFRLFHVNLHTSAVDMRNVILTRRVLCGTIAVFTAIFIIVAIANHLSKIYHDRKTSADTVKENLKHSIPYHQKKECCEAGKGKSLATLCGEKDKISLENKVIVSPERSCVCVDFMFCKMVFVNGASSEHLLENFDSLASVQTLMPDSPILFYDLGLYSGWLSDQVSRIKSLCNLEYRRLDMKKYPAHVAKLSTYAFKVAIINEALREHEVVFWIDASIRFHHPVPESILTDLMEFPFLANQIDYPNGYFTDDTTFNFLKVDRAKFGHVKQVEGCMLLFRNSTYLQKHIIQPWVDCAMERQCIAADGLVNDGCDLLELGARFKREKESGSINPIFYGCNRFDQSALSTILAGEFGENYSLYVRSFYNFLSVLRWPTSILELCTLNP